MNAAGSFKLLMLRRLGLVAALFFPRLFSFAHEKKRQHKPDEKLRSNIKFIEHIFFSRSATAFHCAAREARFEEESDRRKIAEDLNYVCNLRQHSSQQ
jgi:hypothetical protein